MKLKLTANQEITLIELFRNAKSLLQNVPVTIKIQNITGDLYLRAGDVLGEVNDNELGKTDKIENILISEYSFSSENGCVAEYTVWQSGKKVRIGFSSLQ